MKAAVSLRDLPATVVDLLGLQPAHRSRAAHWRPTGAGRSSRVTAEMTTPAFSETG